MLRGLREGEPPFVKQMQKLIGLGAAGFASGGPAAPFTKYLAAAKKHTDDWADNVATANMSGVGKKIASAFDTGVAGGRTAMSNLGSGIIPLSFAPHGLTGREPARAAAFFGSGGGGSMTVVMPVYLDGEKIAETTRRVDNRYKLRNGIPL
jgi:hypothetical protein